MLRTSHVRDRDKGLLRGILSGCVCVCGTDFFSNALEEKSFLVAFVGKLMGMVIFSGSALILFLVQIREKPGFMIWYKGTGVFGLDVCSGMAAGSGLSWWSPPLG